MELKLLPRCLSANRSSYPDQEGEDAEMKDGDLDSLLDDKDMEYDVGTLELTLPSGDYALSWPRPQHRAPPTTPGPAHNTSPYPQHQALPTTQGPCLCQGPSHITRPRPQHKASPTTECHDGCFMLNLSLATFTSSLLDITFTSPLTVLRFFHNDI